MKEIEQGMHALHSASKGGSVAVQALETEPQGPSGTRPLPSTSPAAASSPPVAAAIAAPDARAFALIDQVSEHSPASRAGLCVGDRVVGMGALVADDIATQGMAALAGVVRNHEGRPLVVTVQDAGGQVRSLSLTPARWDGQGLLGCHLTPIPL